MKNRLRNKVTLKLRQEAAAERAQAYAQLTPAQKIQALDNKLGFGVGAVKQRARLTAAQLAKVAPASAKAAAETFTEKPKKTGKKARREKAAR